MSNFQTTNCCICGQPIYLNEVVASCEECWKPVGRCCEDKIVNTNDGRLCPSCAEDKDETV